MAHDDGTGWDTQGHPRINQSKIDTKVKQKSESKLEQTMEKTE